MTVVLDLLFAATMTFCILFVLFYRYMSLWANILICTVKISIPTAYFYFYGPRWTPYDGVLYNSIATELLEEGHSPLSLFFEWRFLISYVDSFHITAYWWAALAQSIFGQYYFAPVYLNIILTAVIGIYTLFILTKSGMSEAYSTYFLYFFSVHWSVLTWSSFVYIKGIYITLFIVAYFYHFISLYEAILTNRGRSIILYNITILASIIVLLIFSRFYVIALLLSSSVAWLILKARWEVTLIALLFCGLPLYFVIDYGLNYAIRGGFLDAISVTSITTTTLRVILTPRPWGLNPEFIFLFVSSIFHWLFIIPATLFGMRLVVRNESVQLLFIFLLSYVAFYSIFNDFASVRTRVQVLFILALFQYHFLYQIITQFKIKY